MATDFISAEGVTAEELADAASLHLFLTKP